MTIIVFFGKCKKINILDVFYFTKQYGLLDFQCRGQSYHDNAEYDDCLTYDNTIQNYYKVKIQTFKTKETYSIKGKKNIKKEIFNYGPVVTTFKYYEDFLYYKNGYYDHIVGSYLGEFSAVIVGWDKEGWIAQSSLGNFWGNNGFFKVKYDNNIEFGEIAYSKGGFIYFKNYYLLVLLIFIL